MLATPQLKKLVMHANGASGITCRGRPGCWKTWSTPEEPVQPEPAGGRIEITTEDHIMNVTTPALTPGQIKFLLNSCTVAAEASRGRRDRAGAGGWFTAFDVKHARGCDPVEHHDFSGGGGRFHLVLLRMVELGHLEVASQVQALEMGTYAYLFRLKPQQVAAIDPE